MSLVPYHHSLQRDKSQGYAVAGSSRHSARGRNTNLTFVSDISLSDISHEAICRNAIRQLLIFTHTFWATVWPQSIMPVDRHSRIRRQLAFSFHESLKCTYPAVYVLAQAQNRRSAQLLFHITDHLWCMCVFISFEYNFWPFVHNQFIAIFTQMLTDLGEKRIFSWFYSGNPMNWEFTPFYCIISNSSVLWRNWLLIEMWWFI